MTVLSTLQKKGSISKQFRAAWEAGQLDEAAELLRVLANDVTDGYGRLTEERAAKLALKPTKALRQFLELCGDEETVTTFLTAPLALAQNHATLAFNMSRLVASAAHFPKLTETLVKCKALDFLADFLGALPPLIDRATRPPYDDASLSIASNLIVTAIGLHKSQDDFDKQLLRAGALDALLDSAPFRNGRPDFSDAQWLGSSTLTFVSYAVYLCTDLSFARRIHKGEGVELTSKIVEWSQNLLELVCAVLEAPGDEDQLGNLPQTCVDGILRLLHLIGEGFPGEFDFRPSVLRATPHLERFSGDRGQIRGQGADPSDC